MLVSYRARSERSRRSIKKRKDTNGRVLKPGESQRANGTYTFRYSEYGRRYQVYADSLDALRRKEEIIQREILSGVQRCGGEITVTEQMRLYFSLKDGLRYTTQINYDSLLKIVEHHDFGKLQIRAVRASMVKRFYIELKQEGYSYETISHIHCHLKLAFMQAVEDDLIFKNPVMFRFTSVIKNNGSKVEAIVGEELERLLAFVREHGDFRKHYDVFVILLGTGLRISELCGLTVQDLDFVNGRISVNRQLKRKSDGVLYVEEPKTAAGKRIIPMTPEVKEAFRHVLANRDAKGMEWIVDQCGGFLFLNREGRPKSAASFDKNFARIEASYNRKYGTDICLTPHVLRHTFCTNLVNSGMNIKSAQYITGHASAKVLLDVYVDVKYDAVEREFAEAVAGGRL